KAPLMIIHGKNDPRVPVGEAEQMYDAIKKRGGVVELLIYNDEGHGLAKLKNRLDAYPKMVQFLDKYVKNK
ncbi:MAG TPA: prolyl oligopeptidase family serine peptidase, partial [Ignavibacteria bacterium]